MYAIFYLDIVSGDPQPWEKNFVGNNFLNAASNLLLGILKILMNAEELRKQSQKSQMLKRYLETLYNKLLYRVLLKVNIDLSVERVTGDPPRLLVPIRDCGKFWLWYGEPALLSLYVYLHVGI